MIKKFKDFKTINEADVNAAAFGIKTDEIGKFWVAEKPTTSTTSVDDIVFESDIIYFANQIRGGLKEKNIIGFFKTQESAKKAAEKQLSKINKKKN